MGFFGAHRKIFFISIGVVVLILVLSLVVILRQPPKKQITNGQEFKSAYSTLTFVLPTGFDVIDTDGSLVIAKAPYTQNDSGSSNAFFVLNKYTDKETKDVREATYRRLIRNLAESTVKVDGKDYKMFRGFDWGRFEGDSAGRINVIFFDNSYLEIIERPANTDEKFDTIGTGLDILSTFKF